MRSVMPRLVSSSEAVDLGHDYRIPGRQAGQQGVQTVQRLHPALRLFDYLFAIIVTERDPL